MIPKYIEQTINDKATSLGDHPALPPDEEAPYLLDLVKSEYDNAMSGIHEGESDDRMALANRLDRLVAECRRREEPVRDALCKLCCDMLSEIFEIPDDTIKIDTRLVDKCDMSKYRMTPEPVDGFQFDDMDDMQDMSDRIYQRRMMDAIVCGAAYSYASDVSSYAGLVSEIDPELPDLYSKIIRYTRAFLFNTEDTFSTVEKQNTGVVDVTIPGKGEQISVVAEGVVFPYMLEQAVKGMLEVAALHGLPDDEERAEYIMKKADYRLAENWDSRLGFGIWKRVSSMFSKIGMQTGDLGANFIIMEIASMNPGNFNSFMKNVLKGTKSGMEMVKSLGNMIEYNKETDTFNNFMKTQASKHQINDNEEYTPEELLAEAGEIT